MSSHTARAERARAGYQVRPLTTEDRARIIELVRISLGEGTIPREAAYWAWKHEQNPFGESPGLVAEAEPGGELVGLRVFMRWQWRLGGELVSSVRAVDTATHPKWQGRGIFSRLTLALCERLHAEGTALVFNTPNDKSRPGYLKMGWSSLGRTSLWVRPVRPLRLLRSQLPRAERAPAPEANGEAGFRPAAELVGQPGFADLLARCASARDRLTTNRSAAYVHWRYAAVPGFDYRAVWQSNGGKGAAIVFRTKLAGALRELRICDLFLAPDAASARVARELLRRLVAGSRCDYAVAMDAGVGAVRRVLVQSGFLPVPRRGPILTVRPLAGTAGAADPLRRSGWGFAIGDLELF